MFFCHFRGLVTFSRIGSSSPLPLELCPGLCMLARVVAALLAQLGLHLRPCQRASWDPCTARLALGIEFANKSVMHTSLVFKAQLEGRLVRQAGGP